MWKTTYSLVPPATSHQPICLDGFCWCLSLASWSVSPLDPTYTITQNSPLPPGAACHLPVVETTVKHLSHCCGLEALEEEEKEEQEQEEEEEKKEEVAVTAVFLSSWAQHYVISIGLSIVYNRIFCLYVEDLR